MVRLGWSGAVLVLVLMFALLQWNFVEGAADGKIVCDPKTIELCKDPVQQVNPACGTCSNGSWKLGAASGIVGASLLVTFV